MPKLAGEILLLPSKVTCRYVTEKQALKFCEIAAHVGAYLKYVYHDSFMQNTSAVAVLPFTQTD